jgi:hypothetical protein
MNPQTLNRYSYCLNNPLKYIDPDGHGWPFDQIKSGLSQALNVVVTKTVEIAQTVKQYETAAAQATGKGIVQGAVAVTGYAVSIAQSSGCSPLNTVIDSAAETVLNHTIAPLLNKTGAGIDDIAINSTYGYIETDISTGGWLANTLDKIPAEGITVPTPFCSAVFINQTEYGSNLPIAQAHEETHVIQQDVLGPVGFLGLYYFAQWIYGGYNNNPFEQQAYDPSNQNPSNWNNGSVPWWY